jgi:hypothetical protein
VDRIPAISSLRKLWRSRGLRFPFFAAVPFEMLRGKKKEQRDLSFNTLRHVQAAAFSFSTAVSLETPNVK